MPSDNRISIPQNQKPQTPTLYDSRFLPLIKKANNGCNESRLELYKVFSNGEHATPNYELARSLLDAMATCENFIFNIENQIDILEYKIFLEMKFEDRPGMRSAFTNLMDYLHEFKVPLRYWPHDTISMMHQIFMVEGADS